jgi:hypothetical protein
MEAILGVAGILFGLKLNEINKSKDVNIETVTKKKFRDPINSELVDTINKDAWELGLKRRKSSENPLKTNIVPADININKEYYEKQSDFMKQFDSMRYDTNGPVPSNEDPNLRREIELQSNFSSFDNSDMTYKTVTNDELGHSNMIPNTSQRDVGIPNSGTLGSRLENFTGIQQLHQPKKEVEHFSVPMKDMTWAMSNGMPVMTSFFETRMVPSYKNNDGDLPFENKIRVRPGINGKNQEGSHAVYRILPKNTDELRSQNNPKISYEKPMNETIKKGELRPVDPVIQYNRPPRFREYDKDTIWAGKAAWTRPALNGKFRVPNTQRTKSISHHGPAKFTTEKAIPTKMRAKVQKAFKQQYPNDYMHSTSAQEQSGYARNLKDTAKQTIKQETMYEQPKINMNPVDRASYFRDLRDKAKKTIKESTLYEQPAMNAQSQDKSGYARQLNDKAKKTIKETTLYQQPGMNTQSQDKSGYARRLDDTAKETIKETTLYQQPGMNTQSQDKSGYARRLDDTANKLFNKQLCSNNQE